MRPTSIPRSTVTAFAAADGHEGAVVFPNLRLFLITCLDPRVDPAHFLGLATGIIIDATVIRALIVAAGITLLRRWNWWLPSWSARLLRVEPSPSSGAAPSKAS